MKRILIISTPKKYEMTRQPLEDLRAFSSKAVEHAALDAEVTITAMDDLVHVLDGSQVRVCLAGSGEDIAGFDFVWLRGRFVPVMNEIALVAEYLERKGVSFANHSYAHRSAYGKNAQMHLLAHLGLPFPKTVYATGEHAAKAFADNLPFPMIIKNNHGAHGDKNFLVQDADQLHVALNDNPDTNFVAQEFIPNDADFRILIAGSKQLIIRRQGAGDTHLNNTSKGASATLVPEQDFSAEVINEARQFAAAQHYDFSGVDVLFDSVTNRHYFLEVNSQPQIISGAFLPEKKQLLADYFAEKLAA